MNPSRDKIIQRIQIALTEAPHEADADFKKGPLHSELREPAAVEKMITEFSRRWQAVGGICHQAETPEDLERILGEILAPLRGEEAFIAPSANDLAPNLEKLLTGLGLTPQTDREDQTTQAARAAVGLTGVEKALAYSGTVVVTSQDPGALSASLLPPVHVALAPVRSLRCGPDRVFEDLSQKGWPRGVVFITGPSRTADIELTLVKGVHGPGEAHVILLNYSPAG